MKRRRRFWKTEFPNFKPVNFWFEYPIHKVDKTGALTKTYAEGDTKNNLSKSGKRNQSPESRKEEFDRAFDINKEDDGGVDIATLSEYLELGDRAVRNRIKEFEEHYIVSKGRVFRK